MRALLIACLLAGCAKDLTQDFEDLATRACACADKKDVLCGKAVLGDLAKLLEHARKSTADEAKAAAATKRLGECLLRSGVKPVEISETINALAARDAPTSAPAEQPAE